MKTLVLLIFGLTLMGSANAQSDFTIGGLADDQTLSRIGHLFFEELTNCWDIPENAGTVVVKERPDMIAGNIVWIEINDETVFQDRIGTRPSGIEEKAQAARSALDAYIQQNQEALHELEIY